MRETASAERPRRSATSRPDRPSSLNKITRARRTAIRGDTSLQSRCIAAAQGGEWFTFGDLVSLYGDFRSDLGIAPLRDAHEVKQSLVGRIRALRVRMRAGNGRNAALLRLS